MGSNSSRGWKKRDSFRMKARKKKERELAAKAKDEYTQMTTNMVLCVGLAEVAASLASRSKDRKQRRELKHHANTFKELSQLFGRGAISKVEGLKSL